MLTGNKIRDELDLIRYAKSSEMFNFNWITLNLNVALHQFLTQNRNIIAQIIGCMMRVRLR